MVTDLREKIRVYMRQEKLSREQMASRLGIPERALYKYLCYGQPHPLKTAQADALVFAYFKRSEMVERQRHKKFLELRTSRLVMERCEEARQHRELVVLYGPSGISKTFALREFVRQRADAGDSNILLITANAVTTPRALILMLSRLLALPTRGQAYLLVEQVIDKLNKDPHLILVDEANHLNVAALEVMRHVHDMTECGLVLVGTQRLYDLFTNGGRKSQDLEQLWSRVGIQDLLPGLAPSEVGQIAKASMAQVNDAAITEIQRTTRGSTRRLTKLMPRLKRLKELNPNTPVEKLVPVAAGQIIA